MSEVMIPTNIDPVGLAYYKMHFLLRMASAEFDFIKSDIKDNTLRNRTIKMFEAEERIVKYFEGKGVNINETFEETSTDKINAMHNVLILMLGLEENKCQEIEDFIIANYNVEVLNEDKTFDSKIEDLGKEIKYMNFLHKEGKVAQAEVRRQILKQRLTDLMTDHDY